MDLVLIGKKGCEIFNLKISKTNRHWEPSMDVYKLLDYTINEAIREEHIFSDNYVIC